MGQRGLLTMVVVLASCSTSKPGQSNLLSPTATADTGAPASRAPGDSPLSEAADVGAPDDRAGDSWPDASPGSDVQMAVSTDTGASPPDAATPAADAAPALPIDAAPALAIDAAPALAIDVAQAPPVDVGVTWDANWLLTDCGITKPWSPKKSYPKYEFALNYGHIFQCLGEPPDQMAPSPWSDCKSPEYEPGKPGGPWAEAWYDSGVCR